MSKGYQAEFQNHLQMKAATLERVSPVYRFALIARRRVVITGGFPIVAAVQSDAAEARRLQGTLETLQQQPYGWILLGIVALGRGAFGVYSLLDAWYRRIDAPDDGRGIAQSGCRLATGRPLR